MRTCSVTRGSFAREKKILVQLSKQIEVISDLHACDVSDSSVSLYIRFCVHHTSKLSAVQLIFTHVFVHAATYCELTQSVIKYFIIHCSLRTRRER